MPHQITKSWTPEDVARLIELAEGGATLLRAASALGRRSTAVQKKARELGKPPRGVRAVKAELRMATANSVDNPSFRNSRLTVFE
jgi:hypothetical protein